MASSSTPSSSAVSYTHLDVYKRQALFSHDLTVSWRGSDDLVGVRGRNNAPFRYTAQSTAVLLDPAGLEAARLEDVPAEIRARYTALPRGIPDRVYELARVAAGLEAVSYTHLDVYKRQGRGRVTTKGNSSIGRAAVSKTAGWGFDSLLACHLLHGAPRFPLVPNSGNF